MSPLEEEAVRCVPRALGLEDREAGSRTHGCFDRAHWHYQLADFPSAWFQTGALVLALAWAGEGSPFAKNENVRAWAKAGVSFLVASTNPDGSLAEVYPFERSYCATAFALLHATQALAVLGEAPADLVAGLSRIARWLSGAAPTDAANQVAACAAALAQVTRLTKDSRLEVATGERVQDLLAMQAPDGFFLEYGGADPGYQSVTLACLAHLARSRPDAAPALRAAAEKGADALRRVLREDGTYEWRTTRRRTQFLYPSGLVHFAPDLAQRFLGGVARGRVIVPSWLDDRYFLHLAADFFLAARGGTA